MNNAASDDEAAKDIALRKLAGVWANDEESDFMLEVITKGRQNNETRKLNEQTYID